MPCKNYKKMLEENKIEYESIDIEEEPELSFKKGIKGIPTTEFKDGTIKVGSLTLKQVLDLI